MSFIIQGMQTEWGPKGISDSLILYWDVANTDSYPGSGTQIFDLSKTQSSGSFLTVNGTNTPYYNGSTNLGVLVFDATTNPSSVPPNEADNRILFDLKDSSLSTITVEMWCNMQDVPALAKVLFLFTDPSFPSLYGVTWYPGIGLAYFSGFDFFGVPYTTLYPSIIDNNVWLNLVFVMKKNDGFNNGYLNNKIYINSINYTLSNVYPFSSQTPSNVTFNTGKGNLGSQYVPGSQGFFPTNLLQANLSTFKIYNRELSQTEITQNYNALKSRFGIF
jgi:hypothetical protein